MMVPRRTAMARAQRTTIKTGPKYQKSEKRQGQASRNCPQQRGGLPDRNAFVRAGWLRCPEHRGCVVGYRRVGLAVEVTVHGVAAFHPPNQGGQAQFSDSHVGRDGASGGRKMSQTPTCERLRRRALTVDTNCDSQGQGAGPDPSVQGRRFRPHSGQSSADASVFNARTGARITVPRFAQQP